MDKACVSANPYENPALMAALLQVVAMSKGKNISVMMPYADSLRYIADWYCQLWGESLGKAVDLNGNTVNVGQTPVKSLGVTDQHSQVQLYTEGPFDKVITMIASTSSPQKGQRFWAGAEAAARSCRAPQSGQNFTPSAMDAPQF